MFDYGCSDFTIERNGTFSHIVKGFFCGRKYPNSIQLVPDSDIKTYDWLIDKSTNSRYFIDAIQTIPSLDNENSGYVIHYLSEYEYNNREKSNSSYNIGTINGSAIIGNQQNATINNGYNLSEIKSLISSKPIEDQELLNKLVERIEIITEDNQPVSKGTLAKFSDVLAKHSDIAIALGTSIIGWLTGK